MDLGAEKILVAGDVNGHFDELYNKVNKVISSHGEFSFLIVAGCFYSDSQSDWLPYKNGTKSVPIDTYILGPSYTNHLKFYPNFKSTTKSLELAEKVICLGKYGVFVTTKGLTVAFLSGVESKESSLCGYSESDVLKFIQMIEEKINYKPIDIFVTSQWPKDITTECNPKNASLLLRRVVKLIVPRYIFSATEGLWYKRAPYNNVEPYTQILSRFIALGKVKTKEKWLFALELTKDIPEAKKPIHCVIPSPYINLSIESSFEDNQYRWDLKRSGNQAFNPSKRYNKKQKNDSDCWFCLSSPNVEKHLIISIGQEIYLALAKGGLVEEHLLISSVTHVKNYASVSDSTKKEINNYKNIIHNLFQEKDCLPVFFEKNLHSTQHLQIDAVPVPQSKCPLLKNIFEEYAAKYELIVKWYDSLSEINFSAIDFQYFYAELPSTNVLFISILDKFPILFPRHVLADPKVLNQIDRINWRKCTETFDVESEVSLKIRKAFQPYEIKK